jgi:hypothetical protein
MDERELVERLGELEVGDRVRVTLSDDETFEGQANPIDYVPEDSLRVEIRPESGSGDRYEISSEYDDGWSELQTRHADMQAEATEWEDLGTVERVETEGEWDWGTS